MPLALMFRNDAPVGGDAACSADAEPAAAGAYVRHRAAGLEVKQIHDPVNLQTLIAARLLKDAEIPGVRGAGGV